MDNKNSKSEEKKPIGKNNADASKKKDSTTDVLVKAIRTMLNKDK